LITHYAMMLFIFERRLIVEFNGLREISVDE
jgi:hypothetical protein